MDRLKVMFIDNRVEDVRRQWELSGAESEFELIPIQSTQPFVSDRFHEACEIQPDIVVVGFDLGDEDRCEPWDGADVVNHLRGGIYGYGLSGEYKGRCVANSGGGIEPFTRKGAILDADANRTPEGLLIALQEAKRQLIFFYSPMGAVKKWKESGVPLDCAPKDYEIIEKRIMSILRILKTSGSGETSANEELEILLHAFLQSRQDCVPLHGRWVHALSHFHDDLWQLGLIDWTKQLYQAAFEGAVRLSNPNCSDRLATALDSPDKWNYDSRDFGITPELVRCVIAAWPNDYFEFTLARTEARVFASSDAYIEWATKWCDEHPDAFRANIVREKIEKFLAE